MEVYAAFDLPVIRKINCFKTLTPTPGVLDLIVYQLMDVDERMFYLKSIASKYRRSHTTIRARYLAHYT